MAIKDRIKKIEKYFKEMQVATVDGKEVIYVVVSFPPNWIVDDELAENKNIVVSEGQKRGEFYFCGDMEDGEEPIFDVIDKNIEKMKEAVERAQLLSAKTRELKEIFEDESISIENLRSLKFIYEKKTRTTSKRGQKPKIEQLQPQEQSVEDVVDNNMEQEAIVECYE